MYVWYKSLIQFKVVIEIQKFKWFSNLSIQLCIEFDAAWCKIQILSAGKLSILLFTNISLIVHLCIWINQYYI